MLSLRHAIHRKFISNKNKQSVNSLSKKNIIFATIYISLSALYFSKINLRL
jgi:hypothetical protein